jgi:L-fuculose-phosphate aldolase
VSASDSLLSRFQTVGSDLYQRGIVSMHGGNLSIRQDQNLVITRSGSRLGYLTEPDMIKTGVSKDDENTSKASSELCVHRAIYQNNPFKAIVHSHPIHATAMSFMGDMVLPEDEQGKLFIPRVPVVGFGREPVPGGFADEIAEALKTNAIVLVHRHGSFARGMSIEEAYVYTEILEISCRILYMVRNMQS